MDTIVINTYKTINGLKAKGFTEAQAEGMIGTITESVYVINVTLKRMFHVQEVMFKIEIKNQHVA